MPRLTRSPTQQKDDLIVGIIRKYSVNYKPIQVAKMAGMGLTSYYSCLRNPSDFRLHQLRGICKGLKVPPEEMQEVLI